MQKENTAIVDACLVKKDRSYPEKPIKSPTISTPNSSCSSHKTVNEATNRVRAL